MKTSKSYLKYFQRIEKNIMAILEISPRNFQKEDYHKLRVEIKKLNALLTSLTFSFKSFNKHKYFKPLKNLFRRAGKIRNYQLAIATLTRKDSQPIQQYLSLIDKRIEKEKIEFLSIYNSIKPEKIKKAFEKIKPFIKRIHTKDLNRFIENERNKITHFFQMEPLLPGNIHMMRKLLKIDFYTRKITDHPIADNLLEEEDNFLELLGKWHDCTTINDMLKKSILKQVPTSQQYNYLIKIDTQIKSTSESLLHDIKERIHKGVYL